MSITRIQELRRSIAPVLNAMREKCADTEPSWPLGVPIERYLSGQLGLPELTIRHYLRWLEEAKLTGFDNGGHRWVDMTSALTDEMIGAIIASDLRYCLADIAEGYLNANFEDVKVWEFGSGKLTVRRIDDQTSAKRRVWLAEPVNVADLFPDQVGHIDSLSIEQFVALVLLGSLKPVLES